MKYRLLFVMAISLISLNNTGCKKTPTEPDGSLTLTLEDVSCTEAWVKITSSDIQFPGGLQLFVDNEQKQNITLVSNDTLLYVDSLLPNHNYKLKAIITTNNQPLTTNELVATTMDTTNHNFTWQTFTFGQHSSSTLYDVAIIDENNIWAVGEIYMNDSLGKPDPNFYNLIKWNGTDWKPERIYFINSQSQSFLAPMKSIFAFDANDIWIGLDQIIRWDGNNYKSLEIPNAVFHSWINKLWGTSSSDLYAVGNGGNIAHYNGVSWNKIESGTTLNINDIWGDFNKRTQEWEILAICGNILQGGEQDRAILKIENRIKSIQVNAEGAGWPLSGIWFKANKKYFVVGSGIYYKQKLIDSVWNSNLTKITKYHTNKIKGNDINDLMIVGAYGETLHFNGMNWKSYMNETGLNSNGTYLAVDIKNDVVITVGYQSSKAVITVGTR